MTYQDLVQRSKFFDKKYAKNNVAIVCHVESTTAVTAYCSFCSDHEPPENKSRYGIRFAELQNKRKTPRQTFVRNVCPLCLKIIEGLIGYEFKKDFCP